LENLSFPTFGYPWCRVNAMGIEVPKVLTTFFLEIPQSTASNTFSLRSAE
jgi:hypothetical protein